MDGLLVDSEPLWFELEQGFCRDRGFAWTEADAVSCLGRGLRATLAEMGKRFGFPLDLDRDAAWVMERFVERVGDLRLKPGAEVLLDAAEGRVGLALASSSPRRLVGAVVERFGLRPRLGAVVTGEDVERLKPEPDIFLQAAAELRVPEARCAVLEDSLAGATAGRAAGMIVVAVPEGSWEGRGFEAVADVCVRDLVEAGRWLGLLD
ncbi:putative hydrolase [Chondromyces apiculatus DSM 436]|uniref:Putative hydrolase n=2 Tax=Chondromyces apiculatus TaxID=51 RepID=A0A017TBI7_9BACT|nr:putative hydrolase [Chondromyces apiculatus DSM 436]